MEGKRNKSEVVHKTKPHREYHFMSTDTVRDVVIGMADGLTVPFALAAGLAGVLNSGQIIITAGLAEIAAGSVAMGLGGYLAAKTEVEHYKTELAREKQEIVELPQTEKEEVADIFRKYGISEKGIHEIVEELSQNHDKWANFMMKFELGLEKPDPKRARASAWTIALSYIVGGLLPLLPYFFLQDVLDALVVSSVITLVALYVFGYVRGRFTGTRPWKNAWQTALVGGLAASVAFLLATWIS